jgi:hypothetical protein
LQANAGHLPSLGQFRAHPQKLIHCQ